MLPAVDVFSQPQKEGQTAAFVNKIFKTLKYTRNEKMSENFSIEIRCFCCDLADLTRAFMHVHAYGYEYGSGSEATMDILAEKNVVSPSW